MAKSESKVSGCYGNMMIKTAKSFRHKPCTAQALLRYLFLFLLAACSRFIQAFFFSFFLL